mgnify:CR=1 FL=1
MVLKADAHTVMYPLEEGFVLFWGVVGDGGAVDFYQGEVEEVGVFSFGINLGAERVVELAFFYQEIIDKPYSEASREAVPVV